MEKGETKLQKLIDDFGALLMLILIVVTFLQVVFRYFFKAPLSWSEESARYFMIWLAMIGSVMAVFTGEHIVVEIFTAKSPRLNLLIKFIDTIFICLFWGIILYYGYRFAWMNRVQFSSAMPWLSMFWSCLALPFGALFSICYSIKRLVEDLQDYRKDQNINQMSEVK